jgi:hypothetical protein
MEIKPRGKAPYRVSSGISPISNAPEQFQNEQDFIAAVMLMFLLTNAGNNLHGESIVDAEGNTVFSVNNSADVEFLRNMDLEGGNWKT